MFAASLFDILFTKSNSIFVKFVYFSLLYFFFYLIISISYGDDTSKVVQTHNNGKISMISYYQDTEQGLELIKQETFHFSGPKSMVGNFKNGIRNGNWIYWHENGMKRLEGSYLNGFKNGSTFLHHF